MNNKLISCIQVLHLNCINQPSLTEKEDFQQMWASNLLICLFCYNPAISVPRISELVIRCIATLTLLKLQESYKTLKSVFCIANNL